MGVLHTGKERFENLSRKTKWEKDKQKKKPPRKLGKNKSFLKLTIPSRRGRREK
jgi:hypothetical protein